MVFLFHLRRLYHSLALQQFHPRIGERGRNHPYCALIAQSQKDTGREQHLSLTDLRFEDLSRSRLRLSNLIGPNRLAIQTNLSFS